MPLTPRGIWTPADSDDWDLTVDLSAMALSIDSAIDAVNNQAAANAWFQVGTIAERDALLPPVRKTNFVWKDSATGLLYRYTGTAWANTTDVTRVASTGSVGASTQNIGSPRTDITGASITFTLLVSSRIRFFGNVSTYSADNRDVCLIEVTNGTLSQDFNAGANSSSGLPNTSNAHYFTFEMDVPAGTHTFRMRVAKSAGPSATVTAFSSASTPVFLTADRIA